MISKWLFVQIKRAAERAKATKAEIEDNEGKGRFHEKVAKQRFAEAKPAFRTINGRLENSKVRNRSGPIGNAIEKSDNVQQ